MYTKLVFTASLQERKATMSDLPSAYTIHQLRDGRYYPMRFGKFRKDMTGRRIGFDTQAQAVWFCLIEQERYEIWYPTAKRESEA